MKLIAIQEDTLINPDKISVIERKVTRGRVSLRVVVDNKEFQVTTPTLEFMKELNSMGVDLTKQFFAV